MSNEPQRVTVPRHSVPWHRHREAERLAVWAEQHTRDGAHDAARRCYLAAADREAMAFDAIPTDRVRTRGIIAVSAVALYLRAEAHQEGAERARHYLTLGLPEEAVAQIASMLRKMEGEHDGAR